MATSNQERLKLGIELNDGVNFTTESLVFNPAQKKPLYVTNADADGEALVRESHYSPASFELKVRIEPQASIHAALVKLGELTDAIQACEKVERGQALEWTPAKTEDTYTLYALSGDITGIPIEVEGDGAGWLLGAPVVTIKLTCRPFLYSPERTVLTLTESAAEPLQVRYINGILGDVPAEARLIVKDTATQDRRFAMWGRDVVTSESLPTLLLPASTSLTGTGFSGESKTRTGAYGSEKVLRGVAVSQPTTLCGTGRIENVGSYAVYMRVFTTASSGAPLFRISYRNGDGPLIPLEWKEPAVATGWNEIYMGSVTFDAVTLGAQTSEVRLEHKAREFQPFSDVNYLMLWPTKASGKARGIAVNTPTSLIAYDNFEQSVGNLEGKSLPYPGGQTWAQAVKTGESGFKVNEAIHALERAKLSDASPNAGCFALAGSTSYSLFSTSVTALAGSAIVNTTKAGALVGLLGVGGRYVSTEKWLVAGLFAPYIGNSVILRVRKNISGTITDLATSNTHLTYSLSTQQLEQNARIVLTVAANGSWQVTCGSAALGGIDQDLASGGALASGKIFPYDANSGTFAGTRYLDSFELLGAEEPGRACYSGKQVEFNPQGCLRQDSTGTYDGAPPYRGSGFYLEPEGKLGLINRVAVRMRRNDNEVEEDLVVVDKHAVEVRVKERFLLPR